MSFLLVSLPLTAFESPDKDDSISSIGGILSPSGTVFPFNIPTFKIGTLDALVQQADELAKAETACAAVVTKVAESLRSLAENDEFVISQNKKVNEKPTDAYITSFSWNKVLYRPDRSIGEIAEKLQKELTSVDNDVKSKVSHYNSVKTNLSTLRRQQGGNLLTKSLTSVVDPRILVQDSEYLESHLIAVPNLSKKDFLNLYETIAEYVVPRSAVQVAEDSDYTLFAVVTFRKTAGEFLQKCREQKWTPRQFTYVEGGVEEEQRQLDMVEQEEKKAWGEAMRMVVNGWSESVQIWLHFFTLRVFVEAVLRYGLPLDYVSAIIKIMPKGSKEVRKRLDERFSYLAGNAIGRKGSGDDAAIATEMAAAGFGATEDYTPFVLYELVVP